MRINPIINKFKIPIKDIAIADRLINKANELLAELGFKNSNILLVSDKKIYDNLDEQTLVAINKIKSGKLILDNPYADQKTLNYIIEAAGGCNLIIALGSGTINDLCKLSSFKMNIDYIIFASAPSMNGYASANASITVNGHKESLPAHLPKAIYFDLNIVANAPIRLIKAGIGDSICFSTCQFDWFLSHLLLNSYYNSQAFEILRPFWNDLINFECDNIRDYKFIELLCETLTVSGLAMYISGGSYPASQGEHLIAHYLEMKYPDISKKSFHGEQIAVTTLTISEIQEQIVKQKQLSVTPTVVDLMALETIFGAKVGKQCQKQLEKKALSEQKAIELNKWLLKHWPEIKNQLQNILVTKKDLLKLSARFNLPKTEQDIGVNKTIYQEALNNAHLIRDRFTSLDIKNN